MKQFSTEEYLKNPNRKIVTRDGKNARVICIDKVCSTHPVLALLFEDEDRDREEVYQYTSKGEYYPNASSPHDLFFVPGKNEACFIYGAGTIVDYCKDNPKVKEIPDKAIDALNRYLDNIEQ